MASEEEEFPDFIQKYNTVKEALKEEEEKGILSVGLTLVNSDVPYPLITLNHNFPKEREKELREKFPDCLVWNEIKERHDRYENIIDSQEDEHQPEENLIQYMYRIEKLLKDEPAIFSVGCCFGEKKLNIFVNKNYDLEIWKKRFPNSSVEHNFCYSVKNR